MQIKKGLFTILTIVFLYVSPKRSLLVFKQKYFYLCLVKYQTKGLVSVIDMISCVHTNLVFLSTKEMN